MLCLSQARTWFSIIICHGLVHVQWFDVRGNYLFCWSSLFKLSAHIKNTRTQMKWWAWIAWHNKHIKNIRTQMKWGAWIARHNKHIKNKRTEMKWGAWTAWHNKQTPKQCLSLITFVSSPPWPLCQTDKGVIYTW
jgi:hypothetical protein